MRVQIEAGSMAPPAFATAPGAGRPPLGRSRGVAVLLLGLLLPLGPAGAAGPDGPAYGHMELADFKERKGDILGSRVELSGWLVSVTGDAILFTDPDDRTGIVVDLSRLGPEDRRRVRNCTRACEATVQGVAAKVQRRNGLRADRLSLK